MFLREANKPTSTPLVATACESQQGLESERSADDEAGGGAANQVLSHNELGEAACVAPTVPSIVGERCSPKELIFLHSVLQIGVRQLRAHEAWHADGEAALDVL